MTHRQFVLALIRDFLAAAVVIALITATIIADHGWIVAIAAFFAAPVLLICWIVLDARARRAPRSAEVQERDARRQLRVIRTVHAEPQPAPVVDLFTREPVA